MKGVWLVHLGCEVFHEGCRESGEVEIMGVKVCLVVLLGCEVFRKCCRKTGEVRLWV